MRFSDIHKKGKVENYFLDLGEESCRGYEAKHEHGIAWISWNELLIQKEGERD